MTDQTIVAVYDTPAHAELAVQDLLQANVPESAIGRHANEGSYSGSSSTLTSRPAEPQGFWASLFGGEPDHDTAVYDRSVKEGGSAVTVKVPDVHVERVMQILEEHNPIDIDERAGSYGMTQTTTRTPLAGGTVAATGRADVVNAKTALGTGKTDGGTLQLSEETLAVGKRVVNKGTTRIRRFVVETPVEESVRLREERVTVERHPVTDGRPVSGTDFTDKTIEMTETAEEAVVAKTARVKEEITIRKDVEDRSQTVRDTVRREDVEIVKVPGETTGTSSEFASTGASGTDPRTRKPTI